MSLHAVTSVGELAAALREHSAAGRRVRLSGRGTRSRFRAEDQPDTVALSLQSLATIERLEPDDLTCSVEPGVPCHVLAEALQHKGLELGCLDADDQGSIGGLYASDPLGAAAPGSSSPRSTLLGLDGVLPEGLEFRSGARVVKSVAGFDVHRLFVGSRGLLYAATLLHLKLRPAPRARAAFASEVVDAATAVKKFIDLRRQPTMPRRLVLVRDESGCRVAGVFAGRAREVASLLKQHTLRDCARAPHDHLPQPPAGHELVVGIVRPSKIEALLRALPAGAPLLVHAGGQFETVLLPMATDALLAALPALEAHAAIALGVPSRVSMGTPLDVGASRLQRDLKTALDPKTVLA
ncbi:MAG: FAD-binding oxidoreductase [Planctomycetota bacterium]